MFTVYFNCPPDRLQVLLELLTGEGLTVSIKPTTTKTPPDKLPGCERAYHRLKRDAIPLAQQIYDMLPESGTFTKVQSIEKMVSDRGYASGSASSTISRLLQAGFITRSGYDVARTSLPFDLTKIVYTGRRDPKE